MENNRYDLEEKKCLPDEGEVYLEEKFQGKSEYRNSAFLLFLVISVPILAILAFFYIGKAIFF